MNLYQLYANPEELKWANAANNLVPEVFAVDKYGNFNVHKKFTKNQIETISKNPEYAYSYAVNVIKGPWPEAEPYIMKDPKYAYYYASEILKHRWLEAEPVIMKDPRPAYWYARGVLKQRWIEAEPYIKTDPHWWTVYNRMII